MRLSQIAVNSVSTMTTGFEESLAAYAEAGFRNVECPLRQLRDYLAGGHTVSDLVRLLEQHEMHFIGGFETVVECFSPTEERTRNHDRVAENAQFVAELGGNILVVGTDGPKERGAVADPVGEMAKAFGGLAKRIKKTGVALCIEFNWSPIVKSFRTACEIARRSRMSNVGVLFDFAHYHCTPSKFEQLTAENVRCVKHVHMDDMRDKPGELCDCNRDRVLPGKGCLDLKSIIRQIEKHGYRGYYSIEMFNEELWKMPARKAAKLMYQSMLPFCRK